MQAVALAYLALQQFDDALAALGGIGVDHAHHVLRGIAIAQAGAPAHFDERREARPDHAGLRLVERPGVDHGVEAGVRRLALEDGELLLPIALERGESPVDVGQSRSTSRLISLPLARGPTPSMKTRRASSPGAMRQPLVQRAAVIAAQFRAAAALALLDGERIGLRAVGAEEAVAHGVEAVGIEVGGEVVKGPRLVEEVVFDDAVLAARCRWRTGSSAGSDCRSRCGGRKTPRSEKTLSWRGLAPVLRIFTSHSSTSSSIGMKSVCSAWSR